MAFVDRFSVHYNIPPVKAYLHEAGLQTAYSTPAEARDFLKHTLHYGYAKYTPLVFNWLIAVLWGNGTDKMIDFFGFNGIREWPGNPDVSAWVLKNGIYVQNMPFNDDHATTCGDTLIMLGREEEYRRQKCKTLEDYIIGKPAIPRLLRRVSG